MYCVFVAKGGVLHIATTCIMPLHTGKGRKVGRAISDIIDYIKNPEKTDDGRLITSYECDSRIADAEFLFAKKRYADITGRQQENDVIAYHFRQSFRPGEVTPEEANRIGVEFAQRFLKGRHAFIVCTHIDKAHTHNHIIWNSTTLDCSRKFRNFWGSTRAVRNLSDTICIEHQLSVIENPKRHGKSYNKWLGDKAKPSQRELLRAAIDTALEKHPDTIDELWTMLQEAGCEVKRRGKTVSLQAPNHKAPARLSSLGEGYSESDLLAILAGKKVHTPRKKAAVLEAPKPSLLIDIQAKLDAGRGAGYEQWAKVFNIKQIAQTMNFLRENSGMDYDELVRQADAATARFNTLSAQIKAAEARMAEIAVLKTQVINYAKTRKIFDGYKASRYSKKYLAEHETEILLHRAAKKTFNDMQLKKLPTVKSLQSEYAALLSEKKAAYGEYRQARDEMKKLLIYRANTEKILDKDACAAEKGKEHDQR